MKKNYLYVLLLPHMDEEYNLGYKIKFGFTENFESRMKTGYEIYYGNTGVKVLHVYEGNFALEDEFVIKQYLEEYCLFKKEWFRCCQEVLGFFNEYNTSEKLKAKIQEIPVKRKSEVKYHKVNYILLDYLIKTYYKSLTNILEIQDKRIELENILREYTERNQYNYLKEYYSFDLEDFNRYQENRLSINSKDFINKKMEEFNGIKRINDRLRYLIDFSENAEENELKEFLELIPGKYKDYYTIVGPDIIKAYGCEENKIKKAWMEKLVNQEVKDDVDMEVYAMFVIGNRYTKVDIKDKLNELYRKLGYKKKAKATDLEVYFYYSIKTVKFQDKTGKWSHGFEILGKK